MLEFNTIPRVPQTILELEGALDWSLSPTLHFVSEESAAHDLLADLLENKLPLFIN